MPDNRQYTKIELEHKFAEDFSNITFPQLAEIYFLEYDFKRSRLVCQIGLKHAPNNFEGQYVLAKIELIEGNTIKAERILKKIFKSNRSFSKAIKYCDIPSRVNICAFTNIFIGSRINLFVKFNISFGTVALYKQI